MDKEKLETEHVLKTQSKMGKHVHSPQVGWERTMELTRWANS